MAAQGLEADTVPIMFCLILTALATMVLVYIYYKGWKVDVKAVGKEAELPKFTGNSSFPGSTGWSGSRRSVLLLECRSDGIFNGVAVNYLWLR